MFRSEIVSVFPFLSSPMEYGSSFSLVVLRDAYESFLSIFRVCFSIAVHQESNYGAGSGVSVCTGDRCTECVAAAMILQTSEGSSPKTPLFSLKTRQTAVTPSTH